MILTSAAIFCALIVTDFISKIVIILGISYGSSWLEGAKRDGGLKDTSRGPIPALYITLIKAIAKFLSRSIKAKTQKSDKANENKFREAHIHMKRN